MSLLGALGLLGSAVAVAATHTGYDPEAVAAAAARQTPPTATPGVYQAPAWASSREQCSVPAHAGVRWVGARPCWICQPEGHPALEEGETWKQNAAVQEMVAELYATFD